MEILFFETASKRSPITEFIDEQGKIDQAAILAVFGEIEQNGFDAKGAVFKHLEGKLWEIKIRCPSGGYRFIYATVDRNRMLILHAFKKKTQKTPIKDLNLAKKRLKEII